MVCSELNGQQLSATCLSHLAPSASCSFPLILLLPLLTLHCHSVTALSHHSHSFMSPPTPLPHTQMPPMGGGMNGMMGGGPMRPGGGHMGGHMGQMGPGPMGQMGGPMGPGGHMMQPGMGGPGMQ